MQESEFREVVKRKVKIVGVVSGQCNPYTVCALIARYGGTDYAGLGLAKLMDGDVWDDEYGMCVARKKAFRDIVDRICMEREVKDLFETMSKP